MFKKVMHILMLMAILAGLFSLTPATSARAAGLCYVNDDAAGSNNGTSWADAYTSLQSAIADTCTEIWVAAGTYKPHASDRSISFTLQSGTAVYGGFAGTETLLSQRDYVANVTILSGDLNGDDSGFTNNSENSYHVVYASIGVDSTSILDGFKIEGGNANGGVQHNDGGGMYINNVNPTLNKLTFSTNSATTNGGGLFFTGTNAPALTNITFSNNTATNGGGMYTSGSPALNSIIFSSNTASFGGGLYNGLSSSPSLSNVTFTINTASSFGGGMYNNFANPTLSNVTFSGNSATSAGGGVYNNTSTSASFTKVTFSGNSAAGGGGMTNYNSTTILNEVTFLSNSATTDGGGMSNQLNGNPTLTNVTFSGNSATDDGGGMYNFNDSYPILTNVTFSGNTATSSGGGMYNEFNSSPTLVNVIIANSTNGDCVNTGSSLDVDSSNNLIENTFASGFSCGLSNGSNGNIIGSDPALGTLTGSPAYFPLGAGSLAINAGTNTGCPSSSQNGIARPQNSTCDIGSYEVYDYSGLTLYAKPSATGLGNCLTWANACTLQAAISVANSGNKIWVMQGTHKPHSSDRTISFTLESGVEIYGGFAGTETLLSQRNYVTNVTTLSGDLNGNDSGFTNNGENSYHVVTSFGVTSSAILDGFTISGGNANGSSANRFGGGMYNASTSSPTLNNLTFTNNYGEFGGGMLNENASAPVLNNIAFANNSAASGGGMANYSGSAPTLTNVTFSGNTANFGGGLLNFLSNPTLVNVTFSGNTSGDDGGGGMYNSGNTPILKNGIIANSTNGGDCVLDAGATIHATSSNNLIEGTGGYTCDVTANSQAGNNIIGSDPALGTLTGSPAYFPLNASSLAIDAGNDTVCAAAPVNNASQNGVTRPQGSHCDIGSYEYSASANIDVTIAGVSQGSYTVTSGSSKRVNYAGVDAGPVVVDATNDVPIIAALREAYYVSGQIESFVQLMGLPAESLSTTYYFPAYNNVSLDDQLRFGNVGNTATTVTVTIAGVVRGTYNLNPGEAKRVNYAGLDAGPVVVQSSGGVPIIAALRDAYYVDGRLESFAQLMGLPQEKLSTKYYFPAYNNVSLDGQLRFGNVGNASTTVTVTIAGVVRGTYNLNPNESKRVNYAGLDAGPVVVESSGGVPITAALRDAYFVDGKLVSFIQLMGLPQEQLSTTYNFPAYNNVSLDGQLRFGNVGNTATTVTVTIAGVVRGTYNLNPSEAKRVNYVGLDAGPVVIQSSGGVPIIAALRDAYFVNGKVESFAQLMGLPQELLSSAYYFPAYNNVSLDGQLRFGVP